MGCGQPHGWEGGAGTLSLAALEMAPAERNPRIPLADCEGAIEELSKAMAEGFSAALDEVIENFGKADGTSAVIDEIRLAKQEPLER